MGLEAKMSYGSNLKVNNNSRYTKVINSLHSKIFQLSITFAITETFCGTHSVILKKPDGSSVSYDSIQKAVAKASPGQQVLVSGGIWKELVSLKGLSQVEIKSDCKAQVFGFILSKTKGLTLRGFRIVGSPAGSDGIFVDGDDRINHDLKIVENEISRISAKYHAIYIREDNKNITIQKNYIHDNLGTAISLNEHEKDRENDGEKDQERNGDDKSNEKVLKSVDASDSKTESRNENEGDDGKRSKILVLYYIVENFVFRNGKDGLVLNPENAILVKGNVFSSNGTSGFGYGIQASQFSLKPQAATLTDNIIIFNHGSIKKNKSSRDIARFRKILDPTDTNNQTTDGTDGFGVVKYTDTTPPVISILTKDHYLSNKNAFSVSVVVTDNSPIASEVYQNGIKILSSADYEFRVQTKLTEGNNIFEVRSKDVFGNVADVKKPGSRRG